MKWNVIACAYDRETKKKIGKERTEKVTTKEKLFKDCKTCEDVHKTYESFWNDLNTNSTEIVLVKKVVSLN